MNHKIAKCVREPHGILYEYRLISWDEEVQPDSAVLFSVLTSMTGRSLGVVTRGKHAMRFEVSVSCLRHIVGSLVALLVSQASYSQIGNVQLQNMPERAGNKSEKCLQYHSGVKLATVPAEAAVEAPGHNKTMKSRSPNGVGVIHEEPM